LLRLSSDVLTYLARLGRGDRRAPRDGGHSVSDIQGAIDDFSVRGEHTALPLLVRRWCCSSRRLPVGMASEPWPGRGWRGADDAAGVVTMPLRDLVPDLPSAAGTRAAARRRRSSRSTRCSRADRGAFETRPG